MKTLKFFLVVLVALSTSLVGQETTSLSVDQINSPNAATLNRGEYQVGLRIYPNGGVLSEFSFGLVDRVFARVYFGGENIIGAGDVNWNTSPGVALRIRLVDENLLMPAIAIGVNTQGYGAYTESTDRYLIKSRGLYAVASRNYSTSVGDLSLHAGLSMSLESNDQDKDLSAFFSVNKNIRSISEIILEYDSALNDNEALSIGDGKGYLNAGFRFFISNNFRLSVYVDDLLENRKNTDGFGREIKLEYRNQFKR